MLFCQYIYDIKQHFYTILHIKITLKDIFNKNGIDYSNITIQAADRYKITIGSGLNAIK